MASSHNGVSTVGSDLDKVQRPSCFAAAHPLGKGELVECFLDDVHSGRLVTGPAPGHPGSSSTLRIVQWNINAMQDGKSPALIAELLFSFDADVLILQEFAILQPEAGYSHEVTDLKRRLVNGGFQVFVATHVAFPTALATRLPAVVAGETVLLDHLRAAIFVTVKLGDATVMIYGTHFNDSNASGIRLSEAEALLHHHATQVAEQSRVSHKSCLSCFFQRSSSASVASSPTLVVGDFNQQRQCDYTAAEWTIITAGMALRGAPEDDGVCECFEAAGFTCSLDSAGADHNWPSGTPPPPTHWTGTAIDYAYTIGLKARGIYVAQTDLSDHLPVVSDWNC